MSPFPALLHSSSLSFEQGNLSRWLRQVGAARLVGFGMLAELGWAFFGSLGLGLGVRPEAGGHVARYWLMGTVLLAIGIGLVAWLATTTDKRLR